MSSAAHRMVLVVSSAAILAAVSPAANAATQRVPDPVGCQNALATYVYAFEAIHAANRYATTTLRRTLHLELVQLIRDRDLEPPTC